MKYAHLFWKLFGLPVTAWDGLLFGDFNWMRAVADDYAKQEKAAAKAAETPGRSPSPRR